MAAPMENKHDQTKQLETREIAQTETTFSLHNFSERLLENTVHFQVLKMDGSFFLWLGTGRNLDKLAVSIPTKFVSILFYSELAETLHGGFRERGDWCLKGPCQGAGHAHLYLPLSCHVYISSVWGGRHL